MYSSNFSREIVLKGCQTKIITFSFNDYVGYNTNINELFIYPIVEILDFERGNSSFPLNQNNIKKLTEDYKGVLFFNGMDVFEYDDIFKLKNINYDLNTTSPNLSNPQAKPTISLTYPVFNLFGWNMNARAVDSTGNALVNNIFQLRFPIYEQLDISNSSSTILSNFFSSIKKGEKVNYKIDYNGNKNILIRVTFLITSISIYVNQINNQEWKNYPIVFLNKPDFLTYSKPGDLCFEISGSYFALKDPSNSIITFGNYDSFLSEFQIGVKSLHSYGLFNGLGANEFIDYKDVFIFSYQSEKTKLQKKVSDYSNLQTVFDDFSKYYFTSSYMVLRTNPKLTGNFKIVIDSNGNTYLETLDASPSLSNKTYKKIKINYREDLSKNIYNAFNNVNNSDFFKVYQNKKSFQVLETNLSQTFENFYNAGVFYLKSNLYDEEYSFFAPLYIKESIPEYFVIFKLNHSLDINYFNNGDRKEYLKNIFKNSSIIKAFKIKGTDFGNLLENHINQLKIKNGINPLKIDFKNNVESNNYIVGIDYKNGVLSEKRFDFKKIIESDRFVYDFNSDIVSLWEKNEMIYPNLLNLEFLFDDDQSDDYEFNNYFGIYCDFLELKELDLDLKQLDYLAKIGIQTPPIDYGDLITESSEFEYFQTNNQNNFELPLNFYEDSNGKLIKGENTIKKEFLNGERVLCINDRIGNLHKINDIKKYEFIEDINKNFTTLVLDEPKKSVTDFIGMSEITFQTKIKNDYSNPTLFFYDRFLLEIKDDVKILDGEVFEIVCEKMNFKFKLKANSNGIDVRRFFPSVLNEPDGSFLMMFSNLGRSSDILDAIESAVEFSKSVQDVFYVQRISKNKILFISKSGVNGSLKFKRYLVNGSQIDAVKYYNREITFNNFISLTNFSLFFKEIILDYELGNDNFVKEYKIEVSDKAGVGPNQRKFKFKVYVDGGFLIETTFITVDASDIVDLDVSQNIAMVKLNLFDVNGKKMTLTFTYQWSSSKSLDFYNSVNVSDTYVFKNKTTYEDVFIGGLLKVNNRKFDTNLVFVSSDDVLKLNSIKNEVVFKTKKNDFSYIKKFYIQSIDDFVFDIPTENEDTFALELENDEMFLIDNQKNLVGWKFFKSNIGILSFYPVRDFSYDTILSDYSYFNLFEEINIQNFHSINLKDGDEVELEPNQSFKVIPSQPTSYIELYGLDSVSNQWILISEHPRIPLNGSVFNNIPIDPSISTFYNGFISNFPFIGVNLTDRILNYFNTFQFNYIFNFYEENVNPSDNWKLSKNTSKIINNNEYDGSNLITFSNIYYMNFKLNKTYIKFKVKSYGNNQIINNLYFYDVDFKNYRGLFGLVDFINSNDNQLKDLIESESPDRFTYGFLKSEFDRLRENKNLKFQYVSKTVPYICRWSIPGTDTRDNPISLNISKAFGDYNFCPSDKNDISPEFFNMEYFVINNFPYKFYNTDEMSNIPSYIYFDLNDKFSNDKTFLDILLTDKSKDWFKEFFTIGKPMEFFDGSLIENNKNEIFDFIQNNGVNNWIVFHRGVQYKITEYDSFNKVDKNGDFSNYKFLTLFLPIKKAIWRF